MAGFFEFAEDETNFSSFMKLTFFIFGLVKLDFTPIDDQVGLKENFFYRARVNFCRFSIFSIVFSGILFLVNALKSDDFVLTATCTLNAITVFQVSLKAFATFQNRERIWNIMQALRDMSEHHVIENRKPLIRYHLEKYLHTMKMYTMGIVVSGIPIIIFPFLKFVFFGIMEPTLNFWYPIDVNQPHTFPLALLWCDWVGYFVLSFLLGVDSLLYAILSIIAMEIDLLCEDFAGFFSSPNHKEGHQEMKKLVDRHIQLKDITKEMQNIYSSNFLFSFVISSFTICFTAFQISVANGNLTIYSFYIPSLGVMTGQIYLLCMHGQKIMNASDDMIDKIYCSDWTVVEDIHMKKQLVLIMQQCQRGVKLTAMEFADISYPTFAGVR